MEIIISRFDAAKQQLDCGVACYEQGDFLAAITLGGAAEELFGKELKIRRPDLQTAWEADKNVLEFFQSGTVTESKPGNKDTSVRKEAADFLASVRNFLKHGRDEKLTFDPESEAALCLQRSIDMFFWMTRDPTLRDDWNRRIRFLHLRTKL